MPEQREIKFHHNGEELTLYVRDDFIGSDEEIITYVKGMIERDKDIANGIISIQDPAEVEKMLSLFSNSGFNQKRG